MTNTVISLAFLLISLFCEKSQSARLVDFYKSPTSPLRSGQLPEDKLIQTKLQTRIDYWIYIENNGKRFWLKKSNLFSEALFSSNFTNNMAITLMPTELFSYQIIRNRADWIKTKSLPIETFVHVIEMKGSWVKINYQNNIYFAKNENFLFAIDLAEHFQTKDGFWHELKKRKMDLIQSKEQQVFNWSQISQFDRSSDFGILKRSVIDPISGEIVFNKFQKVTILNNKKITWIQSLDAEQGPVWWKRELNFHGLPSTEEVSIDKKSLQSRKISKIVESKKSNSRKIQLASASGIFLSQDGNSWKWLSQFATANLPIAISSEQTLIVGDKYSRNLGGTFEDYIHWDQLVHKTQKLLGRPPKYIKIAQINLPSGTEKDVELYIDTGIDMLKFRTSISQ